MSEPKVCTACMFCKKSDYGYSNYTVEGMKLGCLWDENPQFPVDDVNDQKQAQAAQYAEQCQFYREGTGIYEDVDGYAREAEIRDWIAINIKVTP